MRIRPEVNPLGERVRFDMAALPPEAQQLETLGEIDIKGCRVCLITPHSGFKDEELFETKRMLERAGASVYTASSSTTAASGMFGSEITPDMLLDFVDPTDFHAIVLVGGFGVDNYFRNSKLMDLINRTFHAGRLVTAIGTAPSLVAMSGVSKGRKTTVWTGPTNDKYLQLLQMGGTSYTGNEVEIDWPLITGSGQNGVDEFVEVIIEALDTLMDEEHEVAAQAQRVAQQHGQSKPTIQDTTQPQATASPDLTPIPEGGMINPGALANAQTEQTLPSTLAPSKLTPIPKGGMISPKTPSSAQPEGPFTPTNDSTSSGTPLISSSNGGPQEVTLGGRERIPRPMPSAQEMVSQDMTQDTLEDESIDEPGPALAPSLDELLNGGPMTPGSHAANGTNQDPGTFQTEQDHGYDGDLDNEVEYENGAEAEPRYDLEYKHENDEGSSQEPYREPNEAPTPEPSQKAKPALEKFTDPVTTPPSDESQTTAKTQSQDPSPWARPRSKR